MIPLKVVAGTLPADDLEIVRIRTIRAPPPPRTYTNKRNKTEWDLGTH